MNSKKLLLVHSSGRQQGSITREVSDQLVAKLRESGEYQVRVRDLEITELPLIDQALVGAMFTPAAELSVEQKLLLEPSVALIEELQWADEVVIAAPIYNFSVPARLKAWIDMVCRVGITFRYTDTGPEGLLHDKKAWLIVASGGTPIGSEIDYASGYLRHIMNFLGIDAVELVRADGSKGEPEQILQRSREQIAQLLAA